MCTTILTTLRADNWNNVITGNDVIITGELIYGASKHLVKKCKIMDIN